MPGGIWYRINVLEMLVTLHHRPILRTKRLVFKQIKPIQLAGGQENILTMGDLRVKIWTEEKGHENRDRIHK